MKKDEVLGQVHHLGEEEEVEQEELVHVEEENVLKSNNRLAILLSSGLY